MAATNYSHPSRSPWKTKKRTGDSEALLQADRTSAGNKPAGE
ncbi:hypothetical protein [Anabaenopsis elenkinii]|nr:hypothetical protein [Anabaenopsis elenkinii]